MPNAEELIDLYPDAKVILTMRDDEEMWLASMRDTMWRQNMEWLMWFLLSVDPKIREAHAVLDA